MTESEFRHFSRYSFQNHAANVARSTGREQREVEAELGGPATSRSRNDVWLVAREADDDIGYVWLRIDPGSRHAYLMDMHLLPSFRGRGLGRRMMHAVMGEATDHGMAAIDLTVRPDNVAAVRLYAAVGFCLLETECAASGQRMRLVLEPRAL